MNRQAHDREAEYRYRQAITAVGAGNLNGTGEFIQLSRADTKAGTVPSMTDLQSILCPARAYANSDTAQTP